MAGINPTGYPVQQGRSFAGAEQIPEHQIASRSWRGPRDGEGAPVSLNTSPSMIQTLVIRVAQEVLKPSPDIHTMLAEMVQVDDLTRVELLRVAFYGASSATETPQFSMGPVMQEMRVTEGLTMTKISAAVQLSVEDLLAPGRRVFAQEKIAEFGVAFKRSIARFIVYSTIMHGGRDLFLRLYGWERPGGSPVGSVSEFVRHERAISGFLNKMSAGADRMLAKLQQLGSFTIGVWADGIVPTLRYRDERTMDAHTAGKKVYLEGDEKTGRGQHDITIGGIRLYGDRLNAVDSDGLELPNVTDGIKQWVERAYGGMRSGQAPHLFSWDQLNTRIYDYLADQFSELDFVDGAEASGILDGDWMNELFVRDGVARFKQDARKYGFSSTESPFWYVVKDPVAQNRLRPIYCAGELDEMYIRDRLDVQADVARHQMQRRHGAVTALTVPDATAMLNQIFPLLFVGKYAGLQIDAFTPAFRRRFNELEARAGIPPGRAPPWLGLNEWGAWITAAGQNVNAVIDLYCLFQMPFATDALKALRRWQVPPMWTNVYTRAVAVRSSHLLLARQNVGRVFYTPAFSTPVGDGTSTIITLPVWQNMGFALVDPQGTLVVPHAAYQSAVKGNAVFCRAGRTQTSPAQVLRSPTHLTEESVMVTLAPPCVEHIPKAPDSMMPLFPDWMEYEWHRCAPPSNSKAVADWSTRYIQPGQLLAYYDLRGFLKEVTRLRGFAGRVLPDARAEFVSLKRIEAQPSTMVWRSAQHVPRPSGLGIEEIKGYTPGGESTGEIDLDVAFPTSGVWR